MDWKEFRGIRATTTGRLPGDMVLTYDPPPQDPMPPPGDPVEIPPYPVPPPPAPNPVPGMKGRLRLGFGAPAVAAKAIDC